VREAHPAVPCHLFGALGRAFTALVAVLAAASCATSTPGPPAAPLPTPPATPAPVAKPETLPSAQPIPPSVPVRTDTQPPLIRVLLASGADIELSDPGRRYLCVADGVPVVLRGPLTVTGVGTVRITFQVGAFARPENARAEVARLAAAGLDARCREGTDGLTRVLVSGRPGEAASALNVRLSSAGISVGGRSDVFGGEVRLVGEGGSSVAGGDIHVVPLDVEPVTVGANRYRGAFEARPNASGASLINVLNLETYLRGVVPAEMGPRAFPALEALKAQAVAARTYAIAHLGEHEDDGYDICATQACQVYDGATIEGPLTDRAVEETAGMIAVFAGKPIDAMYHSTCGGRTEDAAALMPERAAPYLVGVACRGERVLQLGSGATGPWLGRLEMLVQVGRRFAATLAVPARALPVARALTGRPVGAGLPGLLRAFALDQAPALLHEGPDIRLDQSIVALLDTFRLPMPPPRGEHLGEWELAVTVRLAELAGQVSELSGRLVIGPDGHPGVVATKGNESRELTGAELILERRGDAWRRAAVRAMVGSRATLWCLRASCPVLEVEPCREADEGSAWGWWVREVPLAIIGSELGIAGVRNVRVLRRGKSGRALDVEVESASGATRVSGFPFRMALGLPDTLFVVSVRATEQGPVAHFVGRGWGHGIGMCQNGAYGLALGGATYEEILRTYYTGIAVVHSDPPAGGHR
jgi:peptidoglycan hydrolase-like amidase